MGGFFEGRDDDLLFVIGDPSGLKMIGWTGLLGAVVVVVGSNQMNFLFGVCYLHKIYH